jgi:diguanylate cyclase (GGDEF)-like protein
MKLRTKSIIYFVSFISLWIAITLIVLVPYVQNKFYVIEEGQKQQKTERIGTGILIALNRHENILLDWTKWDEAYAYVEKQNEKFIRENITEDLFVDQEINYVVLYDSNGDLMHSSGFDYELGDKKEVPNEIIRILPQYRNQNGVFLIDDKIIVFSHYQVSDSNSTNVSNGSFAFLFELNDEDISLIGEQLKEEINLDKIRLEGKTTAKKIICNYDENRAFFKVPYLNVDAYMVIKMILPQNITVLVKKAIFESLAMVIISFILLSGIMFVGLSYAVRRLEKLNNAVIKIRKNNDMDIRINIAGKDELGVLRDNINSMLDHISMIHNQLNDYATLDTLTGIFNRRSGFENLEGKMYESKNKKTALTICFVDINELKHVNDTYGHNEGDVYIQHICKTIEAEIRRGDVFCRLGGDEFLIIFPQCTENEAEKTMRRIKLKITPANSETKKQLYEMSISCGLVEYDFKSDLVHYVETADAKMYADKRLFKSKKK